MRVVDHEPHVWFLFEAAGRYYLDARVSRSATEWSVLVELSPQEHREYLAMGKMFLQYLAARIDNFADEYAARDLTPRMRGEVTAAILAWRASGA